MVGLPQKRFHLLNTGQVQLTHGAVLLLVVNFWTRLKVRDIASARPVARPIIVRFWYFLLIILLLFLRWQQPQVSKILPAACHRVLEEVSADWRASYICRAV